MLQSAPARSVSVLVVWEPVLLTDVAAPRSSTLSLISDVRAAQFWDEDLALSNEILRVAREDPAGRPLLAEAEPGGVVWDFIALYPPGVRWEGSPPEPALAGATVIEAIGGVESHLESLD